MRVFLALILALAIILSSEGGTWVLSTDLPQYQVKTLVQSQSTPSVYATSATQIWWMTRTSVGPLWQVMCMHLSTPPYDIDALLIAQNGNFYGGDSGRILWSSAPTGDCDVSWEVLTDAPDNHIHFIGQTANGYVYVAELPHYVWRSKDGQTWKRFKVTGEDTANGPMLIVGNSLLWAGQSGVWESDNGRQWERTSLNESVTAFLQTVDGTIYAASSQLWVADEKGDSWSAISSLPETFYSLIQASDGSLMGGGMGRVWRSTDSGLSWVVEVSFPDGQPVTSLLQTRGGEIYAGELGNVWVKCFHEWCLE